MSAPAHIRIVTTLAQLEALAPAWKALARHSPGATPFQLPTWACAWWHAFAPGELHIVCVYQALELIGLAPFYLEPHAEGTRARLMGIALSDYLDILADADQLERVCTALARHLQTAADINAWELSELAPGALARHIPSPGGLTDDAKPCSVCPVLAIAHAGRLQECLPAHRLQALRTAWKRAREQGETRIEETTSRDVLYRLRQLDRLHRCRWQVAGEPGVTADRRVYELLREAIPPLIAGGHARLYMLRVGSACVGAHLVLLTDKADLSYMTAYDPECRRISPGTILLGYAIERARERGSEAFHFLRGDEPYKFLWGAQAHVNTCRKFTRIPARAGQMLEAPAPAAPSS